MAEVEKLSSDKSSESTPEAKNNEKEISIVKSEAASRETKAEEPAGEGKESPEKGKELPEPIRPGDGKGIMLSLPPIDITELTSMLCSPSMPSHKIMREVADKMMLKSEESESDDGSVGSGRGVGMKGLFDCIMEVSLLHPDSDNSDEDDPDESIPREIPCSFCNKVFGSTMSWKTHVLVAHPQQDPSVLNIRRLSINEPDAKDKGCRKKSKSSSKSDCDKDTKCRHPSKSDMKEKTGQKEGEENVPVNKRRSSLSKPQKGVSANKPEQRSQQLSSSEGTASLLKEQQVPVKSLELPKEAGGAVSSQVESREETRIPAVNQPAAKVVPSEQSSRKRKASDEKQKLTSSGDSIDASNHPGSKMPASDSSLVAKKEKESTPSSQSSSSIPSTSTESETVTEHSKEGVTGETSSAPKHKHSGSSDEVIAKKARVSRSAKPNKPVNVPSRRSARHQK